MTDVSASDDELASSYLDHEATPAEAARVEDDPRLMARVKEMRAAIAFVATPPPLPEADLNRIRATAVAAVGSGASVATAPVVDMAAARIKRLERRNRILSVAAAVVLFGGLIGGIGVLGSGEDVDSAGDSTDDGSDEAASNESNGDDSSFSTMSDSNDGDSEVDADTAEAEIAAEAALESRADDSASDSSEISAAESDAPASHLQKRSSFDPLPDNLGAYASVEELAAAVETLVTEMTTDGDLDVAPAEVLPFTSCEEALAIALVGDTALELDTAEAVLDAVLYTIVVGRHTDTANSVGRLAPSDTCSPATELFVVP